MKGGDKFVSRQIEGKGIGVVSIKPIKKGEEIISEEPLLTIPWWVRHSFGYPRNCLEEHLCDIIEDLPPDKKDIYMSLSDCKSEDYEEKTEMGIWRTNNFALGPSHSKCSNGVFPTIARFNHSCIPNAEFSWSEKRGRQEVRAIKSIEIGEEISLCYFTSKWQLESAEVRREYLFDHYGFRCDCKACTLTGPQLDEDEAKRSRIKVLREQFNDLVYEYSDIDEEDVHDHDGDDNQTNTKTTNLTETELNSDLQQALTLGLERLDLMNDLLLKCRSRLEFCDELLEVAEDCAAATSGPGNNKSAEAIIAEHGYFLSRIVSGCTAEPTLKWKSKLKQDI